MKWSLQSNVRTHHLSREKLTPTNLFPFFPLGLLSIHTEIQMYVLEHIMLSTYWHPNNSSFEMLQLFAVCPTLSKQIWWEEVMCMHLSHYRKISSEVVYKTDKTDKSKVHLQYLIMLSQGLFPVMVYLGHFQLHKRWVFSSLPKESCLRVQWIPTDNIALFSIPYVCLLS